MPRPRLHWAIFLLAWLGLAASSEAAEPITWLLAQSASVPRGSGLYLNLFKFVPVLLIYLLWAATTHWVHDDAERLTDERAEMWNSIVFFAGVLGFAMLWIIPIYFLGVGILVLAYLGPLFAYVGHRNQMVAEEDRVMTSYHFGELANALLRRLGVRKPPFNREQELSAGPPIKFTPGGKDSQGPDPEQLEEAEQTPEYVATKELVFDAIIRRATDIHFEPGVEETAIRYRIDGILNPAEPFDRPTGDAVQRILKLLSGMDVAERRKPQDGTFSAKLEGREIDFRVATSGSKGGEKMIARLFDRSLTVSRLDEAGLRPKMVQRIRDLVTQPSGLFLCAGPVGSGKTTTLYACIREIDRFQRNVITAEEPIEAKIDNVTQNEIDTKTGESFVESLRSILRQDPDVVMVGEIRDPETAGLICQAVNNGRFVFSTLPANDSVTALFRLIELGVDPQALSTAITAVLSQRLVRLLCETCKEPYKPKPEFLVKANLPADKVDVFYRPPEAPEEICPSCGGSGYLGRTGIFELLVITDPIRALIRENPSLGAIKAEARKSGLIYLQEDGLRQVIQGRTSIKELMRVVK